jgi:hypothetical protein
MKVQRYEKNDWSHVSFGNPTKNIEPMKNYDRDLTHRKKMEEFKKREGERHGIGFL